MIGQSLRTVVAAVLVAACVAAAPTTEPANAPPSDNGTGGGLTGSAGPRRLRSAPAFGRIPTQEELRSAMDFARQNMPNLYHMWDALGRGPQRRRLGEYAIREYRRYQQARENELPERAEAMLKQIRSQDEIFALVQEFQDAAPDKQDAVRQRLRDKMRQVVLDMLQERQQRIERLKQMLQREERALENDRARSDATADDRLEKLLNETRPVREGDSTTEPAASEPDRPR